MPSSTSTTRPESVRRPIAITQGDAAGIGPEIIARAWLQQPQALSGTFVVGDRACMQRALRLTGAEQAAIAVLTDPREALTLPPRCFGLWQIDGLDRPPPYGQLHAGSARVAADCVQWAARAALAGDIAALVTAPLNKAALALAGSPFDGFPGHTELLQAVAAEHADCTVDQMPVRMMLANDELRVVLVTIHLGLRQALDAITTDAVVQTLRIADAALCRALGRRPHLALAGLNPHAGEDGRFGREEIDVLRPALDQATTAGLWVSGPHAPDTVFMRARQQRGQNGAFDAVVALYHDQGLIPVKYLGLERGVNVTLGLPLVRTSPDHGTAFDIAGRGSADATSLLAALEQARRLSSAG